MNSMPKAKSKKTSQKEFMSFPKQVQKVCMDAALARYEEHYHPRNKHHKKHIWADFILGAIVFILVLVSVYIFVFYQGAIIREGIELTITPLVEELQSGESIDVAIFVRNNTGQPLLSSALYLPEGANFIITSVAQPFVFEQNRIQLGTLDHREEKELLISGYMLSEINSPVRINAVLEYQGNVLLGINQKLASEAVDITGSSLETELVLPEALVANQSFDFSLQYQNNSPVTNFENVSFLPNWPPGWSILESSINPDPATDYWLLKSIGSLEQGEIVGRAILLTEDLEEVEVDLSVFVAPAGSPLLQQQIKKTTPVRYPNVSVGLNSTEGTVNLGDEVTYKFTVVNNEPYPIKNLQAHLQVNHGVVDPSSLPASLNADGQIVLDLQDEIASGEIVAIEQKMKLRSTVNPVLAFGSGNVIVALGGELHYIDASEQLIVLPLKPATTNINSDLSTQAFSRYYSVEGDQIGRGPVPPIVGETTKYWVFIHLNNQLHPLENVIASGRVPVGVDWTGRVSVTEGEPLNFNEGTRFFQWPIGLMPDYKTNFTDTKYGAAFELAITPKSDQVGEVVDLMQSLQVQGRDSVTGQIITVSGADVTTNVFNDSYASGDGKVTL